MRLFQFSIFFFFCSFVFLVISCVSLLSTVSQSSTPISLHQFAYASSPHLFSEKGSTNHVDISQHFVKWEQKFEFEVDMTVDNESKFIQPLLMRISVRQELDSNRSKHKRLGVVTIDLSEYVTKTSGTGNAITRVFLLQESKMNSLVKLSIAIDNLSSDTDYQW